MGYLRNLIDLPPLSPPPEVAKTIITRRQQHIMNREPTPPTPNCFDESVLTSSIDTGTYGRRNSGSLERNEVSNVAAVEPVGYVVPEGAPEGVYEGVPLPSPADG